MKKIIVLSILLMILVSCSAPKVELAEKLVAVETKLLSTESHKDILSYVGIVKSNQIKKYSFKTGGYLDKIYVKQGQEVNIGDNLASLNTEDIEYQVSASKNNMDSAYAQYQKALNGANKEDINNATINVEKAKSVFEYNNKSYNDMKALFKEGAVSESSLKQSELALGIAEKEYRQSVEILNKAIEGTSNEDIQSAYSQYLAANDSYEAVNSLLNDSMLKSDVSGNVVSILFEESEVVPQGYPVVVVSSNNLVIETGITLSDIYLVKLDTPCTIRINDKSYNGIISSIGQAPSENSLTYPVEINLVESNDSLYMGSTAEIDFVLGEKSGIWLDIRNISNDGEDYVYIVEDERAIRKNIQILKIDEDKILVDGINSGDEIIVSGLDNIKEGYKVKIIK